RERVTIEEHELRHLVGWYARVVPIWRSPRTPTRRRLRRQRPVQDFLRDIGNAGAPVHRRALEEPPGRVFIEAVLVHETALCAVDELAGREAPLELGDAVLERTQLRVPRQRELDGGYEIALLERLHQVSERAGVARLGGESSAAIRSRSESCSRSSSAIERSSASRWRAMVSAWRSASRASASLSGVSATRARSRASSASSSRNWSCSAVTASSALSRFSRSLTSTRRRWSNDRAIGPGSVRPHGDHAQRHHCAESGCRIWSLYAVLIHSANFGHPGRRGGTRRRIGAVGTLASRCRPS